MIRLMTLSENQGGNPITHLYIYATTLVLAIRIFMVVPLRYAARSQPVIAILHLGWDFHILELPHISLGFIDFSKG